MYLFDLKINYFERSFHIEYTMVPTVILFSRIYSPMIPYFREYHPISPVLRAFWAVKSEIEVLTVIVRFNLK